MTTNLAYSILSYRPSLLTNEQINIGVAIQNLSTLEISFDHIKNWSRVEHFDDEIDIDFFKYTVQGIKNRFTTDLIDSESKDIGKITRYFVNELQFTKLQYMACEDIAESIDTIKKIHLRFDYKKSERLKPADEKKFLKKLLDLNKISYCNAPVKGIFEDKINCDFVVNDTCIKLFNLTENNKTHLTHFAKSWAFTSKEMSKQFKFLFLLSDGDLIDKEARQNIESILKTFDAAVLKYDDYVNQIYRLSYDSTLISN